MKNRNITILYIILSLAFLCEAVLSFNRYSFNGYYVDKIINGLWLLMTVFMIIRFWKKKSTKAIFAILVLIVVLSILPMMLPFFAMVYYFSTVDDYQQIELNDTYRLERTRPSALQKPQIYIYKKQGIIEKEVYRTPYFYVVENVLQKSFLEPEEAQLPVQNARIINISKDSLGIEYQIRNKKKIFYHKNKQDQFDDI